MKRKDLLGLYDVSKSEILEILEQAFEMRKILHSEKKKTQHLTGKNVVTLFYENSTRTRVSFEQAAKIMGANAVNITASSSSVQKGETLIDTGKNLDALMTDIIIIRSNHSGAPHLLAKNVKASVINAGDGLNEHPTQALLDIMTIKEHFERFNDLKVVIAGDIKHSRVARSNIWGLNKLGARITVCAPNSLLPCEIAQTGVKVENDIDKAIEGAHVVMALRLQHERQNAGLMASISEYHKFYGIDSKRLLKADANAILLHPGPVNRGAELTGEAADGDMSLILDQVTNGLAVRMALMTMLTGGQI